MLKRKIPTSITKGVGRRILALFVVGGFLPILITLSFAYLEFGRASYVDATSALEAERRRRHPMLHGCSCK